MSLCRGLLWVLKCLLDICYGVEYMHFNGILHGDLKCANVLCKACSTDIRGFICKVGISSSWTPLYLRNHYSLVPAYCATYAFHQNRVLLVAHPIRIVSYQH